MLGPENQNVKVGSTLTLECEADGNPLPHIWWKKDGLPVNETSQVYFTDDAIELTIDHAEESDSGEHLSSFRARCKGLTVASVAGERVGNL